MVRRLMVSSDRAQVLAQLALLNLRHRKSDSGNAYCRYVTDAIGFVREVLRAEPDAWQEEALAALSAGRSVAIRSGHGPGKTALASWAILWGVATGGLVPCTAPTQHQLADVLWQELRRWLNGAELRDVMVWNATTLRARDDTSAMAVARTARSPEGLAGFHARRLLYIIDEASGVPDELMQVVDGALTTEGAQALLVGNPTRPAGYFMRCFEEYGSRFYTSTISSEESPRVAASWIAEMRETWGAASDVYRVRVLGLPPRGEPQGLIDIAQVERAMARYETTVAAGRLEIGVDVARYGEDRSAICARRGAKVIHLEARHGLSVPQCSAWVEQVARDLGEPGERPIIRVDDNGVGGGVTDLLSLALPASVASVQGLNFGGKGNRNYATNAGVWWGTLRELLQADMIALPPDYGLQGQLVNRTFANNRQGKIVLESKDHMRQRGVRSPDKADALSLAFVGTGHRTDLRENPWNRAYGLYRCKACGTLYVVGHFGEAPDRRCYRCGERPSHDPPGRELEGAEGYCEEEVDGATVHADANGEGGSTGEG